MKPLMVVTGASGFVGRQLVRRLLQSGARVRVVCRQPDALIESHGNRLEAVRAGVGDPAGLTGALRGAGTVFHLAACARAWRRDPGEFWAVNVEGTRRLLDAAIANRVDRVVHVSTVLTLPELARAWQVERSRPPTEYERTKLVAERLVDSYVAGGGDAVIVHPARIYGPGPLTDANGVTRMIALYLLGRFRLRLADGDVLGSYVHVDDVARGIVLAAERGRAGGHYVLDGEHASIRGLLEVVAELSGVRRRMLRLRAPVAVALARLAEVWGRLGGQVPITADWVRVYLDDQRIDVRPTARALGYAARPLRQGVAQTLEWLASPSRTTAVS